MPTEPIYEELERRIQKLEQEKSECEETQNELGKSIDNYRTIFNAVNDAIIIHDMKDGSFIDVNEKTAELYGYTKEEILQMDVNALSAGIPPYSQAEALTYIQKAIQGEPQIFQWQSKKKDGTLFWVEVNLKKSILDEQGCLIAVVRDITERKQNQEALLREEKRYRSILETSIDGFWITNMQGEILEINDAYCQMSGYSKEELYSMRVLEIDGIMTPDEIADKTQEILDKGYDRFETQHRHKDGTLYDVEVSTQYVEVENGFFVIFVRDITARKEAMNNLRATIEEKDILLRELYHRTKNTLQVIRSMLVLQAATMPDNEQVQKLVTDTEQRILTISLVHQKLYQSHDLSRIALKDYLQELANLIIQSHSPAAHNVSLKLESESLFLLLDTAIPCGLIVNELLSNALKYAFPDKQQGLISVQVLRNTAGNIEVTVADDGVGVPLDFDFRGQTTLGLRTILAIGEQQLQGTVRFISEQGVTCIIEFPDTLYTERV
jgi:PAS domain S-box-containing protein